MLTTILTLSMKRWHEYNNTKKHNPQHGTTNFKAMDFQDVVITLFIPGILSFVAGRWALTRASSRVTENADAILDSFAQSMVYCDGDVAEMQACLKSYQSKLLWMGANRRNKTMLKRYLEAYTKQRKVSPQAIASLSTVLKMFQLSEVKAATWMVELCEEMGTRQMASVGTLLFLGSRIFQSKEGKAALQPIQAQIMATYAEDERVGGEFLDSAQDAIAEAAYRNTILDAGPSKSVTPGWNVLGLTKERATEIFLEEQKDGFVTDREKMYGGQARQYDKKGRVLSKDGKIANPEEADDDEDDDDDMDIAGTSNVYECGQCGFTLFVAEGRESKFFGPGFKCPDCGASKSEFKGSDD